MSAFSLPAILVSLHSRVKNNSCMRSMPMFLKVVKIKSVMHFHWLLKSGVLDVLPLNSETLHRSTLLNSAFTLG